jgi:putative tricarboxylic transport membrane protein
MENTTTTNGGAIVLRALVASWFVLGSLSAAGPLLIVAPAAPGGGWDQTARVLQHALVMLEPGAAVQVENVPGAAGTIGLARFVGSERGNPDVLLVTGLTMLSAIVMNSAPVTLSDTTPIARLTGEPSVIVVPATSPVRTFSELVAAFKTSPGTISWAGGSAGGADDMLVRLLADEVGVPPADAVYIAFSGGGPALAALLGGQVTVGVSGYSEFAGQIEAGTLRPLALSAPSSVAPAAIPTLTALGLDLEITNWRALVAAPGLSDAERDALVERVERIARSDAWRVVLARHGWDDLWLAGPPLRQFLIAEQRRVDAALSRLTSKGAAPATRGASATAWVTPKTAPVVSVITAAVLMAILIVRRRAQTARVPSRVWWLVGALAVHAVALPIVGFVPAGAALFFVTARLFGSRRPRRDLTIGTVAAIALYVLFTVGLGLSLPVDPLTRWMRA